MGQPRLDSSSACSAVGIEARSKRKEKGLEPAGVVKTSTTVKEMNNNRSLLIEGMYVPYKFQDGFLVLSGSIKIKEKTINLTGRYGVTISKGKE